MLEIFVPLGFLDQSEPVAFGALGFWLGWETLTVGKVMFIKIDVFKQSLERRGQVFS